MKLVLLYIVLAIGFVELALFGLKSTYRGERALELLRQILNLSRKNDIIKYHDVSVEIVKINILPVKISCLPDQVKWQSLPFSIAMSLLIAGIFLFIAWAKKIFPSSSISLSIIISWTIYRLMMAFLDRMASKKNFLSNAVRIEKFAKTRILASLACSVFAVIFGLIIYILY